MVRTPVTIVWKDPYHDWHWFFLMKKKGSSNIMLKGADAPDGTKHDGDTFWVREDEIETIDKGWFMPKNIPDWSPWRIK